MNAVRTFLMIAGKIAMCDCCHDGVSRKGYICKCWCHHAIAGGTRSGKSSMILYLEFLRDHPKGVVAGEIIDDPKEIEA
jgi:hypothetical protein